MVIIQKAVEDVDHFPQLRSTIYQDLALGILTPDNSSQRSFVLLSICCSAVESRYRVVSSPEVTGWRSSTSWHLIHLRTWLCPVVWIRGSCDLRGSIMLCMSHSQTSAGCEALALGQLHRFHNRSNHPTGVNRVFIFLDNPQHAQNSQSPRNSQSPQISQSPQDPQDPRYPLDFPSGRDECHFTWASP
jgi:hypothetical protein